MPRSTGVRAWLIAAVLAGLAGSGAAQSPPYDVRPAIAPPWHVVRFDAATEPGGLIFPVTYTAWIPPGVAVLRGVIVHQHGCGPGSCASGLTGAHDLHWQALARKHDCALVSPAYEQPEGAECQMWCDPRHGSAAAFERALAELGRGSGHPELATVPWALWGHSGGGHWAGGMALLRPGRVVAAWLRSGVPLLEPDPARPAIRAHVLEDAALQVPLMCNPGTKEGVTETEGRFKGVWPANRAFFSAVRSRGGLVGVAIDPLSSHECGNQRYLAIPWLDACLTARLPGRPGDPLRPMPTDAAWLGPITGGEAVAAAGFSGDPLSVGWLPDERIARSWMRYVKDTAVTDDTPPPPATNVRIDTAGGLSWDAVADPESGLAGFVIERDGERIATLPEKSRNPFGRPLFQGLLYSDTPPLPLAEMRFVDTAPAGAVHRYRVIAVNTVGLEAQAAEPAAGPTVTGAAAEPIVVDRATENIGRLRFVVRDWPAAGRLRVPAGVPQITRATLRAGERRDLGIEPDKQATTVHLLLPPDRPDGVTLPATVDVDVAEKTEQFADGRIVLTARDARVEGRRAALESQPGNHRIGFWSDPADAVTWTWRATRWGAYDARLTFSNASPAGSEIEVTIGDQKLVATLPTTGDWYRYVTLPLGRVVLPRAGEVAVTVRCTKLTGGAVMNLKAVTLEPACEGTPPEQAADGIVTLHGRDATVLGTTLRYEPAEAKQTLGFWTRPTDAASWSFTVHRPGAFDVEVLQGCGTGSGGSDMAVVFDPDRSDGGRRLSFTVEDTGGFQQFRPRIIGRVELDAGSHALRVQPVRIAKGAACDIRQVRLVPVGP